MAGTREQILDAAARLIVERGIPAATTKEIARAAGVAEGTLYRHFADKEELFYCVLRERMPPFVALVRDLPARAGKGTVAGNLAELAETAVAFFTRVVPLLTALAAKRELLRQGGSLAERGIGPLVALRSLSEYLRLEQGLGRVRADAPVAIAAQVLLGSCHSYVLVHHLFGDEVRVAPPAEFAAGLVDVVLSGLLPPARRPR
jgi:AcrR family transcriptional regulator